jgi:hypothetical protein
MSASFTSAHHHVDQDNLDDFKTYSSHLHPISTTHVISQIGGEISCMALYLCSQPGQRGVHGHHVDAVHLKPTLVHLLHGLP